MRTRTVLIIAVVGVVILATGAFLAIYTLGRPLPTLVGESCSVRTDAGSVTLEPTQMANAATIAAVGLRRDIPDAGIVVALATALQESKLENLPEGDRDSLGLFQQRPSQGWGTVDQLRDPRYAAGKFYSALLKVKGWQELSITQAAQRVQRSAYPEAYAQWADEAAVLVQGLAGRAGGSVTCTLPDAPTQRGAAAAAALDAGLRLDWGRLVTSPAGALGLLVPARDTQAGWQLAHWIVAHSADTGVEQVSFAGQQWSAERGTWRPATGSVDAVDRVMARVYQA